MSDLNHWLQTPAGRYALAWEQAQLDAAVANIFGYHALQLGLPAVNALAESRMPHRWRAALAWPVPDASSDDATASVSTALTAPTAPRTGAMDAVSIAPPIALVADPIALPFPQASLDLIALPHTLDCGSNPQAVLREVGRVLVHEGRTVITGVNPASLWGLTNALPVSGSRPISLRRLRILLRDTDLELEIVRHGGYGPAPRAEPDLTQPALQKGTREKRLLPALGALWCAVAIKRVRGVKLVGPAWKNQPAASAKAGVAQRMEP